MKMLFKNAPIGAWLWSLEFGDVEVPIESAEVVWEKLNNDRYSNVRAVRSSLCAVKERGALDIPIGHVATAGEGWEAFVLFDDSEVVP